MADNTFDAIVTDPPYELGFMGKSWDSTGIAYDITMWEQCLRVLKPGGHLLAFGGSRTYHRLACAVEDAGFQIRDQIMWVYGSGFPKSHNVSKAIDKGVGAEREVIGYTDPHDPRTAMARSIYGGKIQDEPGQGNPITVPATDAAKQWEGWGTALKPAHEPIVLARKPLEGTVADNVLKWGVGALNIDGTRVAYGEGEVDFDRKQRQQNSDGAIDGAFGASALIGKEIATYKPNGRFPANFIHDGSDEVLELFPETGKSTGGRIGKKSMGNVTNVPAGQFEAGDPGYGDSGSAARFFYVAKANKTDRNEGLEQPNHHPTVKPTDLMRYLCRLITPPNGLILDPFCGSGSTGKAALLQGFRFYGIDKEAEYGEIAEARIRHVI